MSKSITPEQRLEKLENFNKLIKKAANFLLNQESGISFDALPEEEFSSKSEDEEVEEEIISYIRPPDPPMEQIAKPVISLVWPLLSEWLISKDAEGNRRGRFAKWLKLIDSKNIRQLLFDRNQKANVKYGRGLSLEDHPDLDDVIAKLGDATYFIFTAKHEAQDLFLENPHEFTRKLNMITDLHNVIGTLLVEIKQTGFRQDETK